MDIRKLQRAIVDGLEDVKAQDIAVFNTEHLSALFERVVIASGTSNRQTKALAASVRDAVREQGFPVMRTEGEDNGEWIIVDCGAAVVHVMQPEIRRYYHLEEIWGGKVVNMKFGAAAKGLVKAAAPAKPAKAAKPSAAGAKKPATATKKPAARKGPAAPAKTAAKRGTTAPKAATASKKAAPKPAAKAPKTTRLTNAKPVAAKKRPARKAAQPKAAAPARRALPARKAPAKAAPAKKSPRRA